MSRKGKIRDSIHQKASSSTFQPFTTKVQTANSSEGGKRWWEQYTLFPVGEIALLRLNFSMSEIIRASILFILKEYTRNQALHYNHAKLTGYRPSSGHFSPGMLLAGSSPWPSQSLLRRWEGVPLYCLCLAGAWEAILYFSVDDNSRIIKETKHVLWGSCFYRSGWLENVCFCETLLANNTN